MSSTTNSKMMAYDTAKKSFDYVKCENGILTVSGGGSGGGDASSANQELQIQQAQTTNTKLTTVVNDLATIKADLHASWVVQEAINDKIDVRVIKCDTDNIAGQVTIDSTDPVQTVGMAKVYGTLNNTFLTTDADQNLRVFVENQSSTTGLALESTLLNIKTQADKLKFTGDKLQVETITGFATSAKQDTQIQAQADTILAVDGVANKLTPLPVQQAKYTIEAIPSLAPGLNPTFTAPPAGIPKDEGWYFKNTATGQSSQVYFYSYTNPALAVPAMQKAYQIDDVTNSYAIVRILAMNSETGLPFLGIYSRPTGSGDHVPGFYKSRKTYSIPNGALLTQGMKYLIWWGTVAPSAKLHPELARIQLELSTSVGPGLPTEQLAYLTINTDSTALAGNSEYILGGAGFSFLDNAIMDSLFTGESSSSTVGGDASSANQTLQLNQATESNVAICGKLDLLQSSNVIAKAQFTEDEINTSNLCLQVRDELVQRNIASLASTIGQGVYINMETEIPVSGGQKLYGDNTGNLFVRDLAVVSSVDLVKDELFATNGVLSDVIAGTQQFHVAVDALNNDSIGIYGYSPVLSMPEAVYTVDNAMKVYVDNVPAVNIQAEYAGNKVALLTDASQRLLVSSQIEGDINIGNQITGFSLEETQLEIKAKTDQLTFGTASALLVQGDFYQATQPIEGTVSANIKSSDMPISYTDYGTSQALDVSVKNSSIAVTGVFWPESQTVSINQMSFTAQDELITYDNSSFQELQTLNGKVTKCDTDNVTIAGTVPISSGSPLDVHIYGSSDGTAWHHIKTNTNGVVSTNALIETNSGSLTSTNVVGTETYNALDVKIKGETSVSVASSVQVTNVPTETLAISGSVTSQLATVDNGSLTSTLSGTGNSVHALDVAVKNNVSVQNTNDTAIVVAPRTAVWSQVATNLPSVFGPTQIGNSIDTDGYSYIWGYITIGTVTSMGNIYVEFSPDGITWIRSYYSTYVNPGTNITATISVGNSVPLKYYRFYADTGVGLATVNAYFAMK